MQLILDIETNGLNPDTIWCICGLKGDQKVELRMPTATQFNTIMDGVTEVIGQNILGFDIPVLERLLKYDFSAVKLIDTTVLSRLSNPSREGGHSLRSWGERLGFPKGDYNDWSALTDEMVEYCHRDVAVTKKVYDTLWAELEPFGTESIILEHDVQREIVKQMKNGWLVDERKTHTLLGDLHERQRQVTEQVHERFAPLPTFIKEIVPKLKKDGTFSKVGLKLFGDSWTTVGGVFSRVDFDEFNLGSRQQIGRYLQYFGWKPKVFTETGRPQVDESVLKDVDIPEAQLIAEYLLLQKRISMVESWLDAIQTDGRIHGRVNAIGAVTGRMTHNSPNMAQVPAVYSEYGKECRELFIVPKGKKLVGVDASGLELRMLAHYMNDPNYTKELLENDIHTTNQQAAGLGTRDQAKTFIYAFLYGAGDEKIGSIVDGTGRDGKRLKETFLSNVPSLGELRERVSKASGRGYLRGLDGRRLWVRSEHAALNTLLQAAGAIVMKQALVIFTEYAKKWNIDYKMVGNIHDEVQMEVAESDAENAGFLMVESIKAAGVHFDMRCPLDGEYKIGNNWAETH